MLLLQAPAAPAASWAGEQPILGLAAGFVVLMGGASLLVRGSVWIALALGVSRMTVGLTLVAFGTSLPELLVSLTSAWHGSNDIAIANVVGSNAMNVLLIVGLAAVICPIRLAVDRLELRYLLLATALVAVPFATGTVDRLQAGLMVLMIIAFCWQLLRRERRNARGAEGTGLDVAVAAARPPQGRGLGGFALHVVLVAAGLAMLSYGAEWLIDGAVSVAHDLGIGEALIGMTIVAGGTSLPELATSITAARKGHPEIAIGNVLGSNVFNIGCVLGICGLVHPVTVSTPVLLPLLVVTVIAAIALAASLRFAGGVSRGTGGLFLGSYAAYLTWEAHRAGAL